MRVAFIGLGVMGFPMAGHLARAGHEVTAVFNRTRAKAERWASAYTGRAGANVADAVAGCELVALCVGNDDDVRAVVAEALPALGADAIIVDHTTASAKLAREMAALAAAEGKHFVDAPVSGGQAGAENGQLAIMVGGEAGPVERARPVIGAYAKAIQHIGGPGAGQLTKMVNQICIAGLVQGLAEGLHFATQAGLDRALVYEAISKGAAQSWQMDNRWKTMTEGKFDFGFAVDWMRKDLGLVLDEARANGAQVESDGPSRPVLRRGPDTRRPPLGHLESAGAIIEPVIETERLTLAAWTEAERADFIAMSADPEVMHELPEPAQCCRGRRTLRSPSCRLRSRRLRPLGAQVQVEQRSLSRLLRASRGSGRACRLRRDWKSAGAWSGPLGAMATRPEAARGALSRRIRAHRRRRGDPASHCRRTSVRRPSCVASG